MASPSRTAEREEERRHNLRTLAAASLGSAAAALLTSQLWIAGTWIAAAFTPVIVALVSELMNRPAERIARTLTSDRAALRRAEREPLPEAGGAAPPARPDADPLPRRAAAEPPTSAPVRVYRAGDAEPRTARGGMIAPRTRRRKIAYGAVFGTAALAFVIAVAALTVPELVAGGSVGKNDARTTLFGGGKGDGNGDRDKQAPQDTTEDEQEQPQEEQQTTPPEQEQQTTPEEETTTDEAPPPDETAPPGEPVQPEVPPTQQP
jgi:predicted outer membrane lipoprotein